MWHGSALLTLSALLLAAQCRAQVGSASRTVHAAAASLSRPPPTLRPPAARPHACRRYCLTSPAQRSNSVPPSHPHCTTRPMRQHAAGWGPRCWRPRRPAPTTPRTGGSVFSWELTCWATPPWPRRRPAALPARPRRGATNTRSARQSTGETLPPAAGPGLRQPPATLRRASLRRHTSFRAPSLARCAGAWSPRAPCSTRPSPRAPAC